MSPLQYLELRIEDFGNCDWETVIRDAMKKECDTYHQGFFQKASNAADERYVEVFTLLGAISSMYLRPDTDEVYQPPFNFVSMRGFAIDDLSDNHISVLSQLVPSIEDAELQARIADIVWIKGRKAYFPMVPIAIDAYIRSAKLLLTPEGRQYTHKAIDRFERALDLAVSTNQRNLAQSAIDTIETAIENAERNKEEHDFPYIGLIKTLWSYRSLVESSKYIEICNTLASISEERGNWLEAATYWILKADWANDCNDNESRDNAIIRSTEAHVQVARFYAEHTSPNYPAACFQLERAIEKLRTVGGMKERCNELHTLIVQYQELSVASFQEHSFQFDIGDVPQKVAERFINLTWEDAIGSLAEIVSPTKVGELKQQVEGYLFGKDFSYQNLFSTQVVDYNGRPIAQSPALLNATEEDKEIALRARMYQEASRNYQLCAIAMIAPAVDQILKDHYVTIQHWEFLVRYNAFVPHDRVYLFMKGLHAGFKGDFITSSHILVPQIENSLRYILQQRGIQAYSLATDTGLQEAHTLETLLEKTPELVEILGEDIMFDLKALLIRKFGNNYRNDMAHGLMSTRQFYNPNLLYLWWLTLFLIYHGLPKSTNDRSDVE